MLIFAECYLGRKCRIFEETCLYFSHKDIENCTILFQWYLNWDTGMTWHVFQKLLRICEAWCSNVNYFKESFSGKLQTDCTGSLSSVELQQGALHQRKGKLKPGCGFMHLPELCTIYHIMLFRLLHPKQTSFCLVLLLLYTVISGCVHTLTLSADTSCMSSFF